MQATITQTSIYPGDPNKLQAQVQFDDGSGNTFDRVYVFDVGSDPLADIQADVDAFKAAQSALDTFTATVQAAVADNPSIDVAV